MNPEEPHAAYGYAGMGPYQGGQAEFVLVPHADFNCLKLTARESTATSGKMISCSLVRCVPRQAFHAHRTSLRDRGQKCSRVRSGSRGLAVGLWFFDQGCLRGLPVVDSIPERLEKRPRKLGAVRG